MKRIWILSASGTLALVVLLALVVRYQSGASLPDVIEFNRHIRPILSNNCFACHGFDANAREADLRLDVRESAIAPREDLPAITPRRPNRSGLIQRVTSSDPDERMPPPEFHKTLTTHEIALLRRWIEQGAEYEPHWSYITPVRRDPPAVRAKYPFVRNAIDSFVVARSARLGLKPSPEADPVTLLRRVNFDLIGLPPTPEEVDAFNADAYEEVVERLLASPHYGERMAIHWLDVVRFADTDGYHADVHRNVFPYRDYVIASFNENKPFDRFTVEQLAGDLLPDPSLEQQVAAGFNRLNQITREGGAQAKEYLSKYAADRVRTVSTTWMASTLACAECHDHKFDPFTIKDFYSMAAFFADVEEIGVYTTRDPVTPPEMRVPSPQQADSLDHLEARIAELEEQVEGGRRLSARAVALVRRQLDSLRVQYEALDAEIPRMLATVSVEPRMVRVLPRGNWMDESGEVVEPALPEFLQVETDESRRLTRLDLAEWIISPENPMTARAFVNRLWKMFFGTGLSRVLDDLGSQGELPTHPDLLDWLAVEFMESGWDVKHIVRLIVTSATYRQASVADRRAREIDPLNRYLARQSRFRLEAELIRDNALAVSGLLSTDIGGRSVQPYQPEDYWSNINAFQVREGPGVIWSNETDEQQYRRGLYTFWKRSFLHPALVAFDAPTRQECTAERTISNTPIQALVLLNDPTYVEAARVFAENILRRPAATFEDRLDWAFARALSRKPRAEETDLLEALYNDQYERYSADHEAALELVSTGHFPVARDLDPAEWAAWTSVSRSMLNLHELITRH